MNLPVLLRIAVPIGAVLLGEALLRAGCWESMAEPSSRIGATVALKREIRSHSRPIDIVTLGNSRAEHGLDHELLRQTARRHGLEHEPATIRGAHWLTWIELSKWLHDERNDINNALIAISVADLFWPNNGTYEIGAVEPFRKGLIPSPEARSLFRVDDPASFGVWSSLLSYRADLQDYVRDPAERHLVIARGVIGRPTMPEDPSDNLCGMPIATVKECAAHRPEILKEIGIVRECHDTLAALDNRQDWSSITANQLPADRSLLLHDRQRQLGQMPYRKPLIVLMPVLQMWRNDVYPEGYERWVNMMLRPLVESGRISLIDATNFFDARHAKDCEVFVDLYHQNQDSAEELTRALMPQIEALLYDDDGAHRPRA